MRRDHRADHARHGRAWARRSRGVLFAGLMITDGRAEADRIQRPLRRSGMPGADDAAEGRSAGRCSIAPRDGQLAQSFGLRWRDEAALTVVMAARGYPGTLGKGLGDPRARRGGARRRRRDLPRRHRASTAARSSPMAAACSTSRRPASTVGEAQARAYAAVDRIDWPDGFCRRDIGWQAVEREKVLSVSAMCRSRRSLSRLRSRTGSTPRPARSSRAPAAPGRRCCCCTATRRRM